MVCIAGLPVTYTRCVAPTAAVRHLQSLAVIARCCTLQQLHWAAVPAAAATYSCNYGSILNKLPAKLTKGQHVNSGDFVVLCAPCFSLLLTPGLPHVQNDMWMYQSHQLYKYQRIKAVLKVNTSPERPCKAPKKSFATSALRGHCGAHVLPYRRILQTIGR
jgi:hypothetical protein